MENIKSKVNKIVKQKLIADKLLNNEDIINYFFCNKIPSYRKKEFYKELTSMLLSIVIISIIGGYLYYSDYTFFSVLFGFYDLFKIKKLLIFLKNKNNPLKINYKNIQLNHEDFIFISQHFNETFLNDFMSYFRKEEQNLETIISKSSFKNATNIYQKLYVKQLFSE